MDREISGVTLKDIFHALHRRFREIRYSQSYIFKILAALGKEINYVQIVITNDVLEIFMWVRLAMDQCMQNG